jgi:hypothetical protein
MLNIFIHQKNASQDYIKILFHPSQNGNRWENKPPRVSMMEERGINSYKLLVECKLVQTLWKCKLVQPLWKFSSENYK